MKPNADHLLELAYLFEVSTESLFGMDVVEAELLKEADVSFRDSVAGLPIEDLEEIRDFIPLRAGATEEEEAGWLMNRAQRRAVELRRKLRLHGRVDAKGVADILELEIWPRPFPQVPGDEDRRVHMYSPTGLSRSGDDGAWLMPSGTCSCTRATTSGYAGTPVSPTSSSARPRTSPRHCCWMCTRWSSGDSPTRGRSQSTSGFPKRS